MSAVNQFDNDVTLRYKWVQVLKRPLKYLVFTSTTVRSVFDIVVELHLQNYKLYDIYTHIIDHLGLTLDVADVAMVYYRQLSTAAPPGQERQMREALFRVINSFYQRINQEDANANLTADIPVNKVPLLRDMPDLEVGYMLWDRLYTGAREKDLQTYARIMQVQNQLLQEKNIEHTEPIIEMATHKYTVTWSDNTPVDLQDGIDLFNLSVVSFEVPYIQYNGIMDKDEAGYEEPRRRIYYGNRDDNDETPLGIIIQPITQTVQSHTMYFTVWSGLIPGNNQTRDSYVRCVYNLEEGTITVPAPVDRDGEARVLLRVSKAISILRLENPEEIHVRGAFSIQNISINQALLADMILNEPLFQIYLYIDESVKSRADKKRLNIHYKTFNPIRRNDLVSGTGYISNHASVSITIGAYDATEDDSDDLPFNATPPTEGITPADTTVTAPPIHKEGMIRVNVIMAESRKILNQFVDIFTRLLYYYDTNKTVLGEIYEDLIPGSVGMGRRASVAEVTPVTENKEEVTPQIIPIEEEEEEERPRRGRRGGGRGGRRGGNREATARETKVRNLKRRATNLTLSGYARKCQCDIQPIIIEPEEVEDWVNKTFIDSDGVRKPRQVMMFPPPVPGESDNQQRWLFVCPDDDAPRPTVKPNPGNLNSNEFPFVPCCGKTDQLSNLNSKYYRFYEAKVHPDVLAQPKATSKVNYRMTTMKRLPPGRPAFIPKELTRLLRTHTPNNELEDFARVGVPATPNSLLHCISLARRDTEYMQAPTYEAREAYCQNLRSFIADLVQPYIYRQELYDISIEEIQRRLGDPSLFLDPYLYYRGIEEFFDINLFVFNPTGALHPLPGMADSDVRKNPVLEIPRSKLTHIRPYRSRANVIILKHWGAEGDALSFPQCELIFSRGRMLGGNRALEEGETAEEPTGYGVNPTVTNEASYIFGEEMGLILYQTLQESNRTFITSIVDAGDPAARALIQTRGSPLNRVNWEDILGNYRLSGQQVDAYGKLRMLSIVHPKTRQSIYLCVPPSQPLNLPLITEVIPASYEVVVSIFGQPSAINDTGLWYPVIDYPTAVFIPTVVGKEQSTAGAPPAPTNLLTGSGRNPIEAYRRLERLAVVFLQVIRWCWRLSRLSVNEFFDRFVVADPNISTDPIPPQNLRRRLPTVNSAEEAITALQATWPPYFQGGRIHLYSGLADKLRQYLANEAKNTLDLPPTDPRVKPIRYLDRLFTREEDFRYISKAIVLLSNEHLNAWREQQLQRYGAAGLITPIYHQLSIAFATQNEPYLYQSDVSGKIYIVQNVRGGDKLRALNLCLQWYYYRINSGHMTPGIDRTVVVPHVTYGISASQEIIPVENQSQNLEDFMEILSYDPSHPTDEQGRYAAMLPIL